jgi:hypothetical protein
MRVVRFRTIPSALGYIPPGWSRLIARFAGIPAYRPREPSQAGAQSMTPPRITVVPC